MGEAWCAAVHGVMKSQIRLSAGTTTTTTKHYVKIFFNKRKKALSPPCLLAWRVDLWSPGWRWEGRVVGSITRVSIQGRICYVPQEGQTGFVGIEGRERLWNWPSWCVSGAVRVRADLCHLDRDGHLTSMIVWVITPPGTQSEALITGWSGNAP